LLQVDAFTFRAIQFLHERPRVAAEIVADWVDGPGEGKGNASDFFELLASLGEATESGIITQPASSSAAPAAVSAWSRQ